MINPIALLTNRSNVRKAYRPCTSGSISANPERRAAPCRRRFIQPLSFYSQLWQEEIKAGMQKPISGEINRLRRFSLPDPNRRPLVPDLRSSTHSPRHAMIEPTIVWGTRCGQGQNTRFPRFQDMAAISSAKTIANPARCSPGEIKLDRQQRDNTEGYCARETSTPAEVANAGQTTATCGSSVCV